MALSGRADLLPSCPLSGVKRTPQLAAAMSANDLKPTSVGSLAASLAAHSLYERVGTFDQRIMVSVTGIVRRSLTPRLVPNHPVVYVAPEYPVPPDTPLRGHSRLGVLPVAIRKRSPTRIIRAMWLMCPVGPKRTCLSVSGAAAFGGKADTTPCPLMTQSGHPGGMPIDARPGSQMFSIAVLSYGSAWLLACFHR
jgi:hypothetical protein